MLNELIERYPVLSSCREDISAAASRITEAYKNGGKLLLAGNGGSCADCEHIVGELMKGFLKKRPLNDTLKTEMKKNCPLIDDGILSKLQGGLPTIALPSVTGLNSAFCNDVDPELIYAQSLVSLGNKNDVFLGLSTSGNSKNVFAAAKTAKALGLTVIALTGAGGGKLKEVADICICAPETETFKIQELHLPIYHYLCAETEKYFFEV